MLPAWKFASAAAFDPLWMSTTYFGPSLRPSAFVAHQLSFRFQTNVCADGLDPDSYDVRPGADELLGLRLPVVRSVLLNLLKTCCGTIATL